MKPLALLGILAASAAATSTTASTPTRLLELPSIRLEPTQCSTKNISQYLDVPQPPSTVLAALSSLDSSLLAPCEATAANTLDCSLPDDVPGYCAALATAAPADVRALWSAYASSAASYMAASSASVSSVAVECPRQSQVAVVGLSLFWRASTHADCYASATSTPAATGDAAEQPKPTSGAVGRAGMAQVWVAVSLGVAAAVVGSVVL